MARTERDQHEAEVQRRITDMMASAGLSESRAALEVLYLLPIEFVRMYTELFELSVSWSPQTAGGGGKDEGRIKASGRSDGGDQHAGGMNTRNIKAASGSGKRYHRKHWALRSQGAIEAKRKLDRALIRSATTALKDAREAAKTEREEINDG